ncbi:MAG TPA: cytochrome b/b6 domain-containing protein [Acidisoma sp.]|nr:cytochrome b/b6 domain-containing protein [Acidisoma sp.]
MQTPPVTEATRIALGDDGSAAGSRYDTTALALHWLTAALVVTLFALAQIWGFLPKGPLRHSLQSIHMSLGLALAAVIVLRILWRASLSRRVPPIDHGILAVAAHAMHYLLYLLLIIMITSGPIRHWSQGQPIGFFGLFSVPAPFTVPTAWHKPASLVHFWAAWTIIVLAALHAAAALFHHYMLKNGTLLRMMPSRRPVRGH